jgi:uncharacterized protein (TIGR02246 family)
MITQATTTDVQALLDELVAAYTARRVDESVALFRDDAVFVGTGRDELRFGRDEIREQVERDLSQAEELAIRYTGLRASLVGDAAILFAVVTLDATVVDQALTMPMRLTAAARPDGDRLRFAQAHFSLPATDQEDGESFAKGRTA